MKRKGFSPSTLSSLDASLIGFVMAGCIGVGYLAGSWLDGKMGTQHWTPILVIVGVMAGARQMWITVARIRKSFSDGSFDKMNVSEFRENETQNAQQRNRAANADPSHRKPRFFNVPSPPVAEGERSPSEKKAEKAFEEELSELRQLQQEINQLEDEDHPSGKSVDQ